MRFDAMSTPVPFPRTLRGLVLVLAVLAAASSGRAEAAGACPPAEQTPLISLNPQPGRVTYSRQHDVEGLAALRRQNGQRVTGRGAAVGLTEAQLGFGLRVGATMRPGGPGENAGCAYLTSVKATLGYDTIAVYLARDYPASSCAYKVIREHEDRHVAIFRQNLAEFADVMRERLVAEASRMGPIRARNVDTALKTFQDRLAGSLRPIRDDMQRTLERNQSAMDTPGAYAREQSRCDDW